MKTVNKQQESQKKYFFISFPSLFEFDIPNCSLIFFYPPGQLQNLYLFLQLYFHSYNLYQMSQKPTQYISNKEQDFDGLTQLVLTNLKHIDCDNYMACGKQISLKTCLKPLHHEDLHSEPWKTISRDWNISFESSFMDEHEKAFRIESQNFIESVFKQTGDVELRFEVFKKYQSVHPSIQYLCQNEKKLFQKYLMKEQKLTNFLTLIQQNTTRTVALQLKYLAYLAWQKYLEIEYPSLIAKEQLIKISNNFVKGNYQSIFQDSKIRFLNMKIVNISQLKQKNQIKERFLKFLQFFICTVFLVIEQYFENPYSQIEEVKRKRLYSQSQYVEEDISSNEERYLPQFMTYKKISHQQFP